jgi:hypothetical protein
MRAVTYSLGRQGSEKSVSVMSDSAHTSLAGPTGRTGRRPTGILLSLGVENFRFIRFHVSGIDDILISASNSHHAIQMTLCSRRRLIAWSRATSFFNIQTPRRDRREEQMGRFCLPFHIIRRSIVSTKCQWLWPLPQSAC